ncbi:MAG: winged helix-turn-helix domain-containing protein [Candidatus Altiarchaeota archaeon]
MDLWGEIGSSAGIIYSTLSANGKPMTSTDLKKKSKLKTDLFDMALGWLAREGKVRVDSDKNKLMIALAE